MTEKRFGVLINGAGWVATQHVQAFKQNPHADIVAISVKSVTTSIKMMVAV